MSEQQQINELPISGQSFPLVTVERKKKGLGLSIATQQQVLELYGEHGNKTLIAKQLGIGYNTVVRCVAKYNADAVISGIKARMIAQSPKAVDVISHHIGKKSLKAAMYVLDKTAFRDDSARQQINVAVQVNNTIPRPARKLHNNSAIVSTITADK